MVGALGAEVDRLETEIQQLMPGIRHIDLVRMRNKEAMNGEDSILRRVLAWFGVLPTVMRTAAPAGEGCLWVDPSRGAAHRVPSPEAAHTLCPCAGNGPRAA